MNYFYRLTKRWDRRWEKKKWLATDTDKKNAYQETSEKTENTSSILLALLLTDIVVLKR
jgi:hypothetical protein